MDPDSVGAPVTAFVLLVLAVVLVLRRRRIIRDRRARVVVDDLPDSVDLLLAALRVPHPPWPWHRWRATLRSRYARRSAR